MEEPGPALLLSWTPRPSEPRQGTDFDDLGAWGFRRDAGGKWERSGSCRLDFSFVVEETRRVPGPKRATRRCVGVSPRPASLTASENTVRVKGGRTSYHRPSRMLPAKKMNI